MVKVPPGTKTIVAPSRSPTISSGQPEVWTPVPCLGVKPGGSGLEATSADGRAEPTALRGSAGLAGRTISTAASAAVGAEGAGAVASTTAFGSASGSFGAG